jgi:hypothetical protein
VRLVRIIIGKQFREAGPRLNWTQLTCPERLSQEGGN